MPKKTDDEWLPDSRGRYRRKVGWWETESGTRTQYPFSFGTDKEQAKAGLARVRELWSQVVKIHCAPPEPAEFPPPLHECDGNQAEPTWDSESLWIAKYLAAGNVQIPVGAIPEIDDYVYAKLLEPTQAVVAELVGVLEVVLVVEQLHVDAVLPSLDCLAKSP